jgi:hypothetical protein
MIQFRLSNADERHWISAGAQSRVRFTNGLLCRDHDIQSLAQLHDEKWFYGDDGFDQVRFQDAVLAIFHASDGDRSRPYGPFRDFYTEDGHAYADGGLFARYEESAGGWRDTGSGILWQTLTIVEATLDDLRAPVRGHAASE